MNTAPHPAPHDRRTWMVWTMAAATGLLGACQTPPATAPAATAQRGFTEPQIRMLRAAGFHESAEGWELGLNVKILFDVDDDRVRDSARQSILRLGQQLREVQIERLRVEGHTDNTGARAHNEQLSLRRATAVSKVLEQAGFNATHLQMRGLGAAFPVADNNSADGRSENRRVVVVVPPQP